MDLGIKGKRALVFGASQGLGFSIAKALHDEGAKVVLFSSNEERIVKAAAHLGRGALGMVVDLNEPGAAREGVKRAREKCDGPIDILVTNCGGPPTGGILDLTSQHWMTGFQSVWLSALDAIQEVVPEMKSQNWGRILLVTSAAAKEPMPNLTVSNGLRAGLLGMTKTMSNELARFGITINALLPGFTDTERLRELKISKEKIELMVPAGRVGKPEEFAALAAFLASQQAAYISGQAISVDGGYLKGI